MKPFPKQGFHAHNNSPRSPEQTNPSLHDSKSAAHLNPAAEENKKFRETAYYPTSTKSNNLEFLRYTVNIKKGDREVQKNQMISPAPFKFPRNVGAELPKSTPDGKDTQNSVWKPHLLRQSANPEKKEESASKAYIPRNWPLEKKGSLDDRGKEKSERAREPISGQQKKIFTPKCSKPAEETKPVGKFGNSYSTSDLKKVDLANSPTSESVSTRMRRKSNLVQMEDFQKIKFLGEGKFGQVHLVRHLRTNSIYALKQIKKSVIVQNDMIPQFTMEIKLQKYLNHPNVLKLYGIFDEDDYIYLILEYMEEGTLYYQLKRKKVLKQGDASRKLRDILEGMAYLHAQKIAHRDIKPENIVISHDVCKICDFGWAAICQDRRKTLCGTIDYASPELLEGKQYGTAIDLWCMGVLCYELMVGKAPFYHISRKETMRKIIKADISDINLPASVPAETRDFISRLLLKNPQERMSAEEALSHALIVRYTEQEMQEMRSPKSRR